VGTGSEARTRVVVRRDARTHVVDRVDSLNAEDAEGAEEEEKEVGLWRVPCDWWVGTSIAAQSGGEACGTGGRLPRASWCVQLVPPAKLDRLAARLDEVCPEAHKLKVF
jgi:hypothetical protein